MKIGMVLDNEFTGDMRVENEVLSLVEAGFEVLVLCFNYGEKKPFENFKGAKIIRVLINPKVKDKMKGLTNTVFDLYSPFWSKKIKKFVEEYQIDVLHVHDLFLLGGAYGALKKLKQNIPVVSDLHENYPEALKYYKFSNTFPGNVLISIPQWEKTEIKWVKRADHVITVIEEAVDRYFGLGIDRNKIVVVANYVNSTEFLDATIDQSLLKRFDDNFVLSYIGGFDTHRGLESVIKALPRVKKQIPNIKLILVGRGRNENDLKQLAQNLEVEDVVVFEGWQPPSQLPTYITASDACLIPHLKTGHTDNTIPHKLFQYMLLSRPVIATNCQPIERILTATQAGLIYDSDNDEALADRIVELYADPNLRDTLGKNGKMAVQQKYNWERTAQNLVQLYQTLTAKMINSD